MRPRFITFLLAAGLLCGAAPVAVGQGMTTSTGPFGSMGRSGASSGSPTSTAAPTAPYPGYTGWWRSDYGCYRTAGSGSPCTTTGQTIDHVDAKGGSVGGSAAVNGLDALYYRTAADNGGYPSFYSAGLHGLRFGTPITSGLTQYLHPTQKSVGTVFWVMGQHPTNAFGGATGGLHDGGGTEFLPSYDSNNQRAAANVNSGGVKTATAATGPCTFPSTIQLSARKILMYRHNGALMETSCNGQAVGSVAAGPQTTNNTYLLRYDGMPASDYEFIFYPVALTDEQVDYNLRYLSAYYNIPLAR